MQSSVVAMYGKENVMPVTIERDGLVSLAPCLTFSPLKTCTWKIFFGISLWLPFFGLASARV